MISRINFVRLRPYFYQFLGRVLPQVVGIGVSSAIVQNAGIEVFGRYSLFFALIAVTYGVLGSAMDVDFQRSCDADKAPAVLFAKVTAWIMALPLLLLIAQILNFEKPAILLLFAGILVQQSIETKTTYDRISGEDARSVLPRLLPVLIFFSLLSLLKPTSVFGITGLFALSWLAGFVYLVPLYRKRKLDIKISLLSIRKVAPIWLSLLITQVYGNIDLYVIKLFYSDEVVGTYKLAYTFASMAMPAASIFSFIFLSKISLVLKKGDIARWELLLKQQLLISALLGLALIFFMIVMFPYVAQYLYGSTGIAAVVPARILSIAITLNMLTMVFSYILLTCHMEKAIAGMTATGGVFYIMMAFLLVPRYAANGAALAMAVTYLFLLAAYYWFYKNKCEQQLLNISTRCWGE